MTLALDTPDADRRIPLGAGGWQVAASAIHAVQPMRDTVILRLDVQGAGQLVIDFRHHAYSWGTPLSEFPTLAASVTVATEPTFPGAPAVFPLPGAPLDALLWMIGQAAFGAQPAPWRGDDDLLHLRRWPDLTTVPIGLDQVRMVAMLGNGEFTADQLTMYGGVEPETVQRLLNALSVMGVLRCRRPDSGHEQPEPAPTAPPRSLFERLRRRLGV